MISKKDRVGFDQDGTPLLIINEMRFSFFFFFSLRWGFLESLVNQLWRQFQKQSSQSDLKSPWHQWYKCITSSLNVLNWTVFMYVCAGIWFFLLACFSNFIILLLKSPWHFTGRVSSWISLFRSQRQNCVEVETHFCLWAFSSWSESCSWPKIPKTPCTTPSFENFWQSPFCSFPFSFQFLGRSDG